MNIDILSFNAELRRHCDTLLDIHFVDNYPFAVDGEGNTREELYVDDIHLNEKGKKMLSASLFQMIKCVYFGGRLRKELLEKNFLSERLRHVSELALMEKDTTASS